MLVVTFHEHTLSGHITGLGESVRAEAKRSSAFPHHPYLTLARNSNDVKGHISNLDSYKVVFKQQNWI